MSEINYFRLTKNLFLKILMFSKFISSLYFYICFRSKFKMNYYSFNIFHNYIINILYNIFLYFIYTKYFK